MGLKRLYDLLVNSMTLKWKIPEELMEGDKGRPRGQVFKKNFCESKEVQS